MADAQTNAARIGFIAETAYGSTATLAGALKTLRFTEESFTPIKNASWSNEIDAGGNRTLVQNMSKAAAGSFTGELSFTDFEVWLRAAIRAGAGSAAAGVTRYTNGLVQNSYYFEKQFTDIAAAFLGFYGMVMSEASLTLSANDIAKVSFGFVGKCGTKEAATRGASAITAPASDIAMRSGGGVANLLLGGSAFPCAVQSLTLSIQHNTKSKSQLSADSPTGATGGTIDISGSMKCYFPSTSLYEDMLAHTSKSLAFSISNAAGRFGITLPAIQLGSFAPVIAGINDDIIVDIPFLASKGGSGAPYTIALDVEPVV